ncbi:MAG: hypothetical protein V5A27_05680, partial [Halapricum sp.]
MPFADYDDHDDCVAANSDKRDPDAYCWAIKQRVEGEAVIDTDEISRRRVLEAALKHPDELAAYEAADQQATDNGADVFRVLASPGDETDYNGDVLGIGIDFPESGVYIDWRREAFPDPLDEPHVSEYGTIADVKNATGNQIESIESHPTVDQEALPETCRVCGDAQRQEGSMLCADCAESTNHEADPMTNGHDLDPETGEGICTATGQSIKADTMQDLTEDCPHCGEALSVLDQEAADPLDDIFTQAVPVAHSEWSVRELDGIAREMDVLSRQAGRDGAVLWSSADGAIAYFADLPEKYIDAIGEDAFVPSEGMYDAAKQVLEWYEEHPNEFEAGADDGEDIRRARQ